LCTFRKFLTQKLVITAFTQVPKLSS
jgi:hypothetical protein